jgi:uncharacterized protein (TIGR03067 family)
MRLKMLALLAATIFLAASDADDATKNDLQLFQGSWQLISAELDGKKTPAEDVKKIKLTIEGNKFVLYKDGVAVSQGSFTLDPARKPKEVDETITAGPNKGKIFLAIYEIDDKQHKICFAAAGKKRPTTFSAEPGSGQLLQLWKREKK